MSVITASSSTDAHALANFLVATESGASIANPTLTGGPTCAGTFSASPSFLGGVFGSAGVILSSGNVADIHGPNESDGTSTDFGLPGDLDLDALIISYTTHDACVLEFDLICPEGTTPEQDSISFEYSFLSEEYNEYVGSSFDDVLGLFVNSINTALIPGGTPVAVNNVNNDINSAYYIDNDYGDYQGSPPICIEADGYTFPLQAATSAAQAGANHIKLAIADAGDFILDSWVIVKAGSFSCSDLCPDDPNKFVPGICGCGVPDIDTDSDGTPDCNDGCPTDPNKIQPGVCACGVSDIDTDGDGTPDCNDECPTDSDKIEPGECGCGITEDDTDSDGTPDCNDNCPDVANPNQLDTDMDGVGDACDNCPNVPNANQLDSNDDGVGDACSCPGELGVNFCINECIQCDTGDIDHTTKEPVPGCVYHQKTGNGGCALQCIGCQGTCGIENAKTKAPPGKPRPIAGCNDWTMCQNAVVYDGICGTL
jgi:hypothetical protein